jgi:hypothetical protein
MTDFVTALGWLAWGFAAGYFWNPVWEILKKIYSEARIAQNEWRNPKSRTPSVNDQDLGV